MHYIKIGRLIKKMIFFVTMRELMCGRLRLEGKSPVQHKIPLGILIFLVMIVIINNIWINQLWSVTTPQFVRLDSFINANSTDCDNACKALIAVAQGEARLHIESLTLQGALITAVSNSLSKSSIKRWSSHTCIGLETLATPLFRFVRKALLQQLPTANLQWHSHCKFN